MEKIGFKCGLEIHKQLEGKKLFCSCPALVNDPNPPDIIIKRKLRVSPSELGEIDKAAKYEMEKNKEFYYEACSTSSCLVELDEEPPHSLNEDALDTALIVSILLNAKPVDELQFMRKVVIDGSNTTGFQRTALVATDGYLDTKKGIINIPTICLEEEAAKKISQKGNKITYRLDRLGVPLVEIATSPDIKDPEHAKEVAEKLGMILNSTGRVKRGLGSIRQDINLSLKNTPRIEIKGFQDLRSIPKVINNEIKRLQKEKSKQPHVRKVEPNFTTTYLRPMPGASRMYPETDVPTIRITKNRLKLLEIPELITDRAINFERKYKLSIKIAREIIKENIPFDYYAEKYKLDPKLIAKILLEIPKDIKTRYKIKKKLTKKDFEFVLSNIQNKKISKDAVPEILLNLAQNKKIILSKYKPTSTKNIEQDIKKIIQKNKGASFNAIMGEVMKKYRGKIDNKLLVDLVKKYT